MPSPMHSDLLLRCTQDMIDYRPRYGSDHRCVDVTIDLTVGTSNPPPRYKWREADWKEFCTAVESACNAERIVERSQHITTTAELDSIVSDLLDGYVSATERTVPVAEKSPFSKRWFSHELKQQLQELNKLKNRAAKRTATKAERDAVKPARNAYHSALRAQKRKHWKEWFVICRAKRGKRDLRDLRTWTQVRSVRKKTGGSPVGCSRNTTARKGERTV
ncbi:hypothetical protein DFH07DRAFT_1065537 [Mycena maculata]|uniref:Endonuclease/exonuclease/phosphatase domain-containing protein n=1 Tax=Mycena maculata TaxID=230809 RepID=A0AAD7I179_9AGAR|nr:hypothetical protein DFH07DRAFT_1065537 [Mycena maculata]